PPDVGCLGAIARVARQRALAMRPRGTGGRRPPPRRCVLGPRRPEQLEDAEDQQAAGAERGENDQCLLGEHGAYSRRAARSSVQTFCYHEFVFIKEIGEDACVAWPSSASE